MKVDLGWIAHDDKEQKQKLDAQREYYGREYKRWYNRLFRWYMKLYF